MQKVQTTACLFCRRPDRLIGFPFGFFQIFLTTLRALLDDAEDLDEDQEMVGANQIALLFLDWTDPEKAM
jgi:hypothetical protein